MKVKTLQKGFLLSDFFLKITARDLNSKRLTHGTATEENPSKGGTRKAF